LLKIVTFIFLVLFLYSCSENTSIDIEIPKSSKVEMLVKHSDEFEKQVLSYDTPGGRVHFAIGFGIANSIMIEGDSANVIVDTSDSVYEAEQIYTLFKSKNDNPIEAIIYTHNHGDHTFGSAYYLKSQEKKPQIIAHEDTDFYVQRILGILNPIITKRSSRMFGTLLPEEDLINVGIGPSLSVSKSPAGYLKPDITFKDSLEIKIAGINIELYHAPGETNDQIFIWLPVHKALMPGDNIYKTFPNLYTIRGTSHRDVIGWINSLDHMNSFGAEFLFPSHTKPILGRNEIKDAVTLYRDGIQYTHDQTIRLMNEGLYPDQIVDMIQLPESISNSPYFYEFYGTLRWSVKSIFNGYLGWFNGNPSELDPLSRYEKALRISNLAGGDENLLTQLQEAVINKDMQWALELSDYLISLDSFTKEVIDLRVMALKYIGLRSSNPNKRNYFLSTANELSEEFNGFPQTMMTEELLNQISLDTLFSVLSVRFNPQKHDKSLFKACFEFDKNLIKNITLRNGVAAVDSNESQKCDLNIITNQDAFKKVLVGLENPISLLSSGKINVDGESIKFLEFLSKFR